MKEIILPAKIVLQTKLLKLQADLIEWQAMWANADNSDDDWFDYCEEEVRHIQHMIMATKLQIKKC